ncbi:AIR synthase family protein [Niabella yanshanensis]|uniref:AIR synthase family protein n=1 Tax=Niabella yanshanensis TaxID=577386 RepID=A0ABZ0W9E5_9BACT|nr:AIR synthase family protein [Niabella yanshanensis]WQD38775.1 AIR synthase family protein [Niabella yanshanensis]
MSEQQGKVNQQVFETFIHHNCGRQREEVLTGPGFGVDVSVIDLAAGMVLALTSDPLSLIPSLGLQESAWMSVHLMANDMATTGHAPMYGQFVLNLPSSFSKSDFKIYWEYIHQFCLEIGVAITGGHTGFIEGQNSSIAGGGTLAAVLPKDRLLLSQLATPGDVILVTKTCALSSSAILAMSFPETVRNRAGAELYQKACESFYHTSSLPDALSAVNSNGGNAGVTAMHDVTEGGVLGAIYELCVASGCGAVIYNDSLPVDDAPARICEVFDLDPRYCVGAGAMIIACKKESSGEVIARLASRNIPCVEVGELREKQNGIILVEGDEKNRLTYREADPYWEVFYKALKSGWK